MRIVYEHDEGSYPTHRRIEVALVGNDIRLTLEEWVDITVFKLSLQQADELGVALMDAASAVRAVGEGD